METQGGLGRAAEEIVVAAIQEDVDLIVLSRRKKARSRGFSGAASLKLSAVTRLVRFFRSKLISPGVRTRMASACAWRDRREFLIWNRMNATPVPDVIRVVTFERQRRSDLWRPFRASNCSCQERCNRTEIRLPLAGGSSGGANVGNLAAR